MTPHALSARELVAVWEAGGQRHPVDRALLLLAAALPHRTHDELAALPVGRRDVLLLRVREATLGPAMACASPCPRCGARLEFRAVVGELLKEAPPEDAPREHGARGGGVELRFRLLDSRDLALSARTATADEARRALLRACLLAVRPLRADGEQAAADPVVTDSIAADSAVADSAAADSDVADSDVADSVATDSTAADSDAADSDAQSGLDGRAGADADDSPAAVEIRGGDLEGPFPATDAGREDAAGAPPAPDGHGEADGSASPTTADGGGEDGSPGALADGWGPPPAELDDAALAALAEALLAADPMMDLQFAVTCLCGHRWTTLLDPAVFVWSEVSAAAMRLLREVDRLARAYGWSQADILEMSAARRGAFLELVP